MNVQRALLLVSIFWIGHAHSVDFDRLMEGFDDGVEVLESDIPISEQQQKHFKGSLELALDYSFTKTAGPNNQLDERRVSAASLKLNLDYQRKLTSNSRFYMEGYAVYNGAYQINGRSVYSARFLGEYESELEVQDTYITVSLARNTDLSIGRKTLVWGTSDNLRVTDRVNPLDKRTPGRVDIEDLRLALGMVSLDHIREDWIFSLSAIPEVRYDKNALAGSEFYIAGANSSPREDRPGEGISGDRMQWAFSATGRFSGWDLALYAASLKDLVGIMDKQVKRHNNYRLFGIAFNYARGSWLLKAEGAVMRGLAFNRYEDVTVNRFGGSERKNRADLMIGFEYTGLSNVSVSMEIANRHITGFQKVISPNENVRARNMQQLALRIQADRLNDRLHTTYLASLYRSNGFGGGFHRVTLEYDISDQSQITLGVIDYLGGDSPQWDTFRNNDRVFAAYRWYF